MPEDQQQDVLELQLNSDSMSSFRTESGVTGGVLGGDWPRLELRGGGVVCFDGRRLLLRALLLWLLVLLPVGHSVRESGLAGVNFKVCKRIKHSC